MDKLPSLLWRLSNPTPPLLPVWSRNLLSDESSTFAKVATLVFKGFFIALDLIFISMVIIRLYKELKNNVLIDMHKITQHIILIVLFLTWGFNYIALSIDPDFSNYKGYYFINIFFVWEHLYIIINQLLWFIMVVHIHKYK